MYNINTPLRLLQLVLAVITVGLNGYGKAVLPSLVHLHPQKSTID